MNKDSQPQKLDPEFTDRIIRNQIIYKDAQLKVILKKYIEITAPSETLSEEKLQQLTTDFLKEVSIYEFQIAKATKQLDAQTYDREQNEDLNKAIIEGIKQIDKDINHLRDVYVTEEKIKNNRQQFETLSKQIFDYEDTDNLIFKIQQASQEIDNLKENHKKAAKLIKEKEKQLSIMLQLMQDLIEEKSLE